jgi:chromosome partitioning protein
MAIVIVVANLKGGSGKTAVAVAIATTLHTAGHKVLIVDTDTQGTARTWAAVAADANRDGPPVVALDGRSLRRDLDRVTVGFDVAVIDTAPRLGAEVRAALLVADLVLIPTTPGPGDVWALRATLDVIDEARGVRPDLRAALVLNRATHTALSSATAATLATMGIPVLGSLGDRVAHGEALAAGRGVIDYAPSSKAAAEVQHLTRAILKALERKATT